MNYTVWRALDDAGLAGKLLDIARTHVKFALEHGDKNTLPCRKDSIKAEIQKLRSERDALIETVIRPASNSK